MDWAVVTFDKAVTKEQREGIARDRSAHLFPVKWKSLEVAAEDLPIEWTPRQATARSRKLDGGKTAEVVLKAAPSAATTTSRS